MRVNKYLAQATGLSRRAADKAIQEGRITINQQPAQAGQEVSGNDIVTLDGKPLSLTAGYTTIVINKPAGYVVSRDGQGSKTVYDLIPTPMHKLKPVGRLDKESSGLLLLTDDGQLANRLTHPRYQKTKVYELQLNKPLLPTHKKSITGEGVKLEDGLSRFDLEKLKPGDERTWKATLQEGRNRQIRRTFAALGYDVRKLHRTKFGGYTLEDLETGQWRQI